MDSQRLKIQLPLLGILALAIVGLIFFDVMFLGRTLQPSNIVPHIGKPAAWQASSAILPVFNPATKASDGFADLNASAWQFEPGRYWMARNFQEKQSPWWNPYSASGTLGPEVLVDIKFSPHTLVTGWLFNASAVSFDFGLVLVYGVGIFFMLLVFREIFQLGWVASVAGALVYLLNGFAVPNLNTHIGQPYFFSPLLLFAVLYFSQRQSLGRWIFLVVSHAILLTVNILTTLSLVLIVVHLLGMAFFLFASGSQRPSLLEFLRYSIKVVTAIVTALMLVAPLWFPIIQSFFVTDMVADFENRAPQKARGLENFLSVFTPRHFWESLSHISRIDIYPDAGLEKNESLIAYAGIFTTVLAACGVCRKNREMSVIAWICFFLIVFSYARIFGFAGFVSYMPVMRSIGNQYWGCMSAIALTVLVAFGVRNIQRGNVHWISAAIVLLLQMSAFFVLYNRLGFPTVFPYFQYVWIAIGLFVFAGISVLVVARGWIRPHSMAVLMAIAMLAELLFYMNTVRPLRYSPIEQPPEFIGFLKANIGDGRVLNIGQDNTLYPEYGAMFGIKQADTQNPGLFPWYEKFFDSHFGNDTFMFLALDGSSDRKRKKAALKQYVLDEAALDTASIKYILVADGAKPYLNYLHGKNYPVVYQKDGVSIFENVDYTPSVSLAAGVNGRRINGNAIVESYRNTEVVVQTEADSPAMLVLSDTWHPAWKATVDEQPAEVELVHEAFRGVALPSGAHRVRIYYAPSALRYGIYAMTAATSLLLLLLLLCWRSSRKAHER